MNRDERWRWLLSTVGAAITASSIAGQTSGYFSFLGRANSAINVLLLSIRPLNTCAIITVKVFLLATFIWVLFYFCLRQYSRLYQGGTLEMWIEEVKLILTVNVTERRAEIAKTNLALFSFVPLKAIPIALMPFWPGKRIFVVSGLEIHLWKLIAEVLFSYAILACTIMVAYLGFKTLNSIL